MFDLGWSEMAIIMLVALIVIGPKDLPKVARTIGQWTGKARALARDFQRSLDDMAREAELDEIKKTITKAGRATDIKRAIKDVVDPDDDLERAFDADAEEPRPAKKKQPAKAGAKAAGVKPAAAQSETPAAARALPPVAGDERRVGEAPTAEVAKPEAATAETAPEARG